MTYTTATTTGTITAGGTDVGNHCDDCATQINLPFPVSVYGTPISVASVGSDGDIHFVTDLYNKLFYWAGCVPVDPMGGQDPFLNTLFPNYADLVTDESVGPCPGCGIFTQTLGNCAQPAIQSSRWKTTYFSSPAGIPRKRSSRSPDRRLQYAVGDPRGEPVTTARAAGSLTASSGI